MNFLLFLHLLGVIIAVGNIIITAFWKIKADLSKNSVIIHQTVKNVMLADFLFTLPGILLMLISGGLMSAQAGYSLLEFNWLTLSLVIFIITGLIWVGILLPLQRRMIQYSDPSIKSGTPSKDYQKASFYWTIFGTIATILPVVILFLMIHKTI